VFTMLVKPELFKDFIYQLQHPHFNM